MKRKKMAKNKPELDMTEQRQKVWDALKELDEQREKHQGAFGWPPKHSRIAEAAGVPIGGIPGIMQLFRLHEYIDYEPGERLVFLREPAEAVRQ
jgi:hypothetical protein